MSDKFAHYKVSFKPKPGKEGKVGYYGYKTYKTIKADIEEVMKHKYFPNQDEHVINLELLFEGDDLDLLYEIRRVLGQIAGVGKAGIEFIGDAPSTDWDTVDPIKALVDTLEDQINRLRELVICLKWWLHEPNKDKPVIDCEECVETREDKVKTFGVSI